MGVRCSHCGEELLGSVNRCWRCGHEFVSRAGPAAVPPVRRAPIDVPVDGAVPAEILDASNEVADEGQPPPVQFAGRSWTRRGSPFAKQEARPRVSSAVTSGPRIPSYPRHAGAVAGTVAAIVLGLLSLLLAFFFPLGGVVLAAVGLGMGVWGLRSRRRGTAIFGILICCLAFATSAFTGAVELYTYLHGVSPFETAVPTVDPSL